MRQPESSMNQHFIKNDIAIKDERFSSVVSLSKAMYRSKRRADRNFIYFKLAELMGEENTIENQEFLVTVQSEAFDQLQRWQVNKRSSNHMIGNAKQSLSLTPDQIKEIATPILRHSRTFKKDLKTKDKLRPRAKRPEKEKIRRTLSSINESKASHQEEMRNTRPNLRLRSSSLRARGIEPVSDDEPLPGVSSDYSQRPTSNLLLRNYDTKKSLEQFNIVAEMSQETTPKRKDSC